MSVSETHTRQSLLFYCTPCKQSQHIYVQLNGHQHDITKSTCTSARAEACTTRTSHCRTDQHHLQQHSTPFRDAWCLDQQHLNPACLGNATMARTRRLLFVSVPMHGHLNPLLEAARLLVKQGQAVLFVTYECKRTAIQAAGIPFKSLGPDCIDHKQQAAAQADPYATKKARMLAAGALFTGVCRFAAVHPASVDHPCHSSTLHRWASPQPSLPIIQQPLPLSLSLDSC